MTKGKKGREEREEGKGRESGRGVCLDTDEGIERAEEGDEEDKCSHFLSLYVVCPSSLSPLSSLLSQSLSIHPHGR